MKRSGLFLLLCMLLIGPVATGEEVYDIHKVRQDMDARKDAELKNARTPEDRSRIESNYRDEAKRLEADRKAANKAISDKTGVELKQGGMGSQPDAEGGRGVKSDIDTDTMSRSDASKTISEAKKQDHKVTHRGASSTIEGTDTTIHHEGEKSKLGSSAREIEDAGGYDKESARGKDSATKVDDHLKKGGKALTKDPRTMTKQDLADLGKSTSRIIDDAGLDHPELRQKADALKRGVPPEELGLKTPKDIAEFQKQCKQAAVEGVKNTAKQTAVTRTELQKDFNRADENYQKAKSGGDPKEIAKARAEFEQAKSKSLEFENAQAGGKKAASHHGAGEVYAEANGYKKVVTSKGKIHYVDLATGKSMTPAQVTEAIAKQGRVDLKSTATKKPPTSMGGKVIKGGVIIGTVIGVNEATKAGAEDAVTDGQVYDSDTKFYVKATAHSVLHVTGVKHAWKTGKEAGDKAMDQYKQDVQAGKIKDNAWNKAFYKGKGAAGGALNFVKSIVYDPAAELVSETVGLVEDTLNAKDSQQAETEMKKAVEQKKKVQGPAPVKQTPSSFTGGSSKQPSGASGISGSGTSAGATSRTTPTGTAPTVPKPPVSLAKTPQGGIDISVPGEDVSTQVAPPKAKSSDVQTPEENIVAVPQTSPVPITIPEAPVVVEPATPSAPAGTVVGWIEDENGKIVSTHKPDGTVVHSRFDKDGNLIDESTYAGNSAEPDLSPGVESPTSQSGSSGKVTMYAPFEDDKRTQGYSTDSRAVCPTHGATCAATEINLSAGGETIQRKVTYECAHCSWSEEFGLASGEDPPSKFIRCPECNLAWGPAFGPVCPRCGTKGEEMLLGLQDYQNAFDGFYDGETFISMEDHLAKEGMTSDEFGKWIDFTVNPDSLRSSEAMVSPDVAIGRGADLLGDMIRGRSDKAGKKFEGGLVGMAHHTDIKQASNSGNQTLADAKRTVSQGGSEAGAIHQKKQQEIRIDHVKEGNKLVDAVIGGIGDGLSTAGATFGAGVGSHVAGQIFDRSPPSKPDAGSASGSSASSAGGSAPVTGGRAPVTGGTRIAGGPAGIPAVPGIVSVPDQAPAGESPVVIEPVSPPDGVTVMADAICPKCGQMYNPAHGHACPTVPTTTTVTAPLEEIRIDNRDPAQRAPQVDDPGGQERAVPMCIMCEKYEGSRVTTSEGGSYILCRACQDNNRCGHCGKVSQNRSSKAYEFVNDKTGERRWGHIDNACAACINKWMREQGVQ